VEDNGVDYSEPDNVICFVGTNDSGTWFDGRFAYVRIWTDVLTQAQLEAEMVSATAVKTNTLYSEIPCVSDVIDVSGHGHDWNTYGTVSYEAQPNLSASILYPGSVTPTITL